MQQEEARQRLAAVRADLDRAATAADRDATQVTLIAVSKSHAMADILPFIAAGHRDFGENRLQEATEKWTADAIDRDAVRLHFIGQLQSNKAADAVALCDAIHSVDRSSLVAALARAIDATGRSPELFVQVNVGDEPQKGGVATIQLPALLADCRSAGLMITGLMAVPPMNVEAAPYFALLAKLAREEGVPGLSMGMSADAAVAVSLGATHVRIGTTLFGQRA